MSEPTAQTKEVALADDGKKLATPADKKE